MEQTIVSERGTARRTRRKSTGISSAAEKTSIESLTDAHQWPNLHTTRYSRGGVVVHAIRHARSKIACAHEDSKHVHHLSFDPCSPGGGKCPYVTDTSILKTCAVDVFVYSIRSRCNKGKLRCCGEGRLFRTATERCLGEKHTLRYLAKTKHREKR